MVGPSHDKRCSIPCSFTTVHCWCLLEVRCLLEVVEVEEVAEEEEDLLQGDCCPWHCCASWSSCYHDGCSTPGGHCRGATSVVGAMVDDLRLMLKNIATATNTLFVALPACYFIASCQRLQK
jgi:hypothetical protein